MSDVRVRLDDKEFRKAIKRLQREGRKPLADALNKVAFEVLDELELEAVRRFNFSGPQTQKFLGRGFRFDKAEPSQKVLRVLFEPKTPKRGDPLRVRRTYERQVFGATVTKDDPGVGPSLGGLVAAPVATSIKRTPSRGRIQPKDIPALLVRRNKRTGRSKAFVSGSGKAILQRQPGGGIRVLYALARRITIRPRYRFFQSVTTAAKREFPRKAARVLEKINLRRQGGA